MTMKSLLNKITGNESPQQDGEAPADSEQEHHPATEEVDHFWMKEDLNAKKPVLEKDPRIDTGILRNRIADKIAKMNNH